MVERRASSTPLHSAQNDRERGVRFLRPLRTTKPPVGRSSRGFLPKAPPVPSPKSAILARWPHGSQHSAPSHPDVPFRRRSLGQSTRNGSRLQVRAIAKSNFRIAHEVLEGTAPSVPWAKLHSRKRRRASLQVPMRKCSLEDARTWRRGPRRGSGAGSRHDLKSRTEKATTPMRTKVASTPMR